MDEHDYEDETSEPYKSQIGKAARWSGIVLVVILGLVVLTAVL